MLDIQQATIDMKGTAEVHIVGNESECRELLLLLKRGFSGEPLVVVSPSANSANTLKFKQSEERALNLDFADNVLDYLYEPDPSLLKAGCFKLITQWFGVQKLHPLSHLYTSRNFIPTFPGRKFHVAGMSSFSKNSLKQLMQNESAANITVRNFPASAVELHKRLKLSEGGNIYLFATTLANGKRAFIRCEKANPG